MDELVKPIPDGYIDINFRERVWRRDDDMYVTDDDFHTRYYFKDIESLDVDDRGIIVKYKRRRVNIPWTSIIYMDHVYNSEEYVKQVAEYQRLHPHNMICGDYNPWGPMPGFQWYCGPAKDGSDEGCGFAESRRTDDQDRTIEDIQKLNAELGDE